MARKEFKTKLERHKNQIDSSIKFLQQSLEDLNKRSYEFYEFIESHYFDLEERLTKLERKIPAVSGVITCTLSFYNRYVVYVGARL